MSNRQDSNGECSASIKAAAIVDEFGRRVAQRRKALGLTLDELSTRAGVERTYLESLERGTREVRLNDVLYMAIVLDVPASWLLGG